MKAAKLVGQRFGKLIVIRRIGTYKSSNGKPYGPLWDTICDCGNHRTVETTRLRNGHVVECIECSKKTKADKLWRGNKYDLETYDYGVGYTNKGEAFYFDKEDYELIKNYTWYSTEKEEYVKGSIRGNTDKKIYLHTLIMGGLSNQMIVIDHINGNRKDNRKCNLRYATRGQNMQNTNAVRSKLGAKGIRDSRNGKYNAYIIVNKEEKNLGTFDSLEKAIEARKDAERKYFGEYSYDNSQEYAKQYEIKDEIK